MNTLIIFIWPVLGHEILNITPYKLLFYLEKSRILMGLSTE